MTPISSRTYRSTRFARINKLFSRSGESSIIGRDDLRRLVLTLLIIIGCHSNTRFRRPLMSSYAGITRMGTEGVCPNADTSNCNSSCPRMPAVFFLKPPAASMTHTTSLRGLWKLLNLGSTLTSASATLICPCLSRGV